MRQYLHGISIHALVKRATDVISIGSRLQLISIHALVKRATNTNEIIAKRYGDFNPRPRKEGDSSSLRIFPAKLNFNPRPRKEGDGNYGGRRNGKKYFNPRPRKEGDTRRRRLSV